MRTLLNNNGTQSSGGTTYNLAAADDWANGADAALKILLMRLVTASLFPIVVSPVITSATYDAATGILSVTGANMVSGVIDVSKLSITGHGGTYTLTSAGVTASSSNAFAIALNAADQLAVNGVLNNNGTTAVSATTFNLAAASWWNTQSIQRPTSRAAASRSATSPRQRSHQRLMTAPPMSSRLPAPIWSRPLAPPNDITISALTITGEGGATRTLSTTANVEVTSATSFTFTLLKRGHCRGGLAAEQERHCIGQQQHHVQPHPADDWDSVITSGNIADPTGNGITVSNAAPSILGATYDA